MKIKTKLASTVLAVAIAASSFCTQAYAAPTSILHASTSAGGAQLSVYQSESATASFHSSFRGKVSVELYVRRYTRPYGAVTTWNYFDDPKRTDMVQNMKGATAYVSCRYVNPDGNLVRPILYAESTNREKTRVVHFLQLGK